MKNLRLFALTCMLAMTVGNLCAQTPQSFNYQAVVRDAGGQPISNQTDQG